MALIAEEVVEEWLNQQGYFTIRGIKVGVREMDILAVKWADGPLELHHYEVQAAVNPVSYICPLPKEEQKKTGKKPGDKSWRSVKVLRQGVKEWVEKKYLHPKVVKLREQLANGKWTFNFAVNKVYHEPELQYIKEYKDHEVYVVRFQTILNELRTGAKKKGKFKASGKDLIDLMLMYDDQ